MLELVVGWARDEDDGHYALNGVEKFQVQPPFRLMSHHRWQGLQDQRPAGVVLFKIGQERVLQSRHEARVWQLMSQVQACPAELLSRHAKYLEMNGLAGS